MLCCHGYAKRCETVEDFFFGCRPRTAPTSDSHDKRPEDDCETGAAELQGRLNIQQQQQQVTFGWLSLFNIRQGLNDLTLINRGKSMTRGEFITTHIKKEIHLLSKPSSSDQADPVIRPSIRSCLHQTEITVVTLHS